MASLGMTSAVTAYPRLRSPVIAARVVCANHPVAWVRSDRRGGGCVYRISGTPDGSGDRVVQTEAVDGRRDPKRKTKRAA